VTRLGYPATPRETGGNLKPRLEVLNRRPAAGASDSTESWHGHGTLAA
jgi:hypothetical protein